MILLLIFVAIAFWWLFKSGNKYKDVVPERYSPFRGISPCDNVPNAYNDQRLYKNNPQIYPVRLNYVKALAINKRKEYKFLIDERNRIKKAYAK